MSDLLVSQPDLYACVLRLDAIDGAHLEHTQGRHAHGLFLDLMRRADPALATRLHAPAPTKPFTVAPLTPGAQQLRPGSSYSLRIALLRQELFPAFVQTFLQPGQDELWLGAARFVVREVLATPGAHAWADTTSWHALLAAAQPRAAVTLHFVTPTAFSLGADASGRKQIGLFPDPVNVFGSLLRRWNDLAPTPLPPDLLQRVTIWPSRYSLHTEVLQFAKHPQLGFVGRCSYDIHGQPEDRRQIAALAAASFFLGVGYKTTQGMGLVRAERWPEVEDG